MPGLEGKETGPADRLSFDVESFTDGDEEFISTHAENASLSELVKAIFEQVESSYLIYDKLQGIVTISADITRLEDVLTYMLHGTDYTFKQEGDLFLIGSKELDGLKTTRTVKMRYRPTYQAIELIPGAEISSSPSNSSTSRPGKQAPCQKYKYQPHLSAG